MNGHQNPLHRNVTIALNVAVVIVFIILFLLSGCVAPPPQHAKNSTPASTDLKTAPPHDPKGIQEPPRPAVRQPEEVDASAGTADALAHKAEAYSREIEPMISKRSSQTKPNAPGAAPGSSPPSTVRHPQESSVDWADPNEFRLTDAPANTLHISSDPVPVRPAIQTSPTQANQVAAATGNGAANANLASANVPAAVEADSATRPPPTNRMLNSTSDQLLDKLTRRVRDNPRDVSAQLEYQLLQFLLDEQVPQLAALAPLPTEDRELLTAFLDGLTLFRNTLRSDNNMLLSRKIRPLLDMSDRLRSQADLVIPTIVLCSSVDGYGKYTPVEARFAAGVDHRAVIYCEIANFASNLNGEKLWETQLKQDMTLYTEGGIAVWSDKTETIDDSARVRRQDFFINKRIVIPANLTIGRYILKVTVVDLQANRVAEASVPIVIAAK